MVWMTWLADVLRDAGLQVDEQPGWKTSGRGPMAAVRGILCHHTGGSTKGNAPSLALVRNGRADLPGPLSQLVLGRDGTFFVVAAGRCNHAGAGIWQGITAGNSSFIGIEAENAGTGADPWPVAQMDAYIAGCAAILRHLGLSAQMVAGHKEYATPPGRKIDPTFNMAYFRTEVQDRVDNPANRSVMVPAAEPFTAMLRRGSTGNPVKIVQAKIGVRPDGDFGPATEAALKKFQAAHGLVADGMVGPKTWAGLGV